VPVTVPPAGEVPGPDALMTPAWASPHGRVHPNRSNTAQPRNFGASDAMVGTEVASLLLQSPLWSILSPRLTGVSS
jgi:hypothetical protein